MSEMARVTYVKRAQQRYAMVPDIDPATKEQKSTPIMTTCRTCRGEGKVVPDGKVRKVQCSTCSGSGRVQKTDKRGALSFRRLTIEDRRKPLPMPTCDKCGTTIEVGAPYKHISPKSGPYGGQTRFRCGACPSWHVWEYSNSLDARLSQVEHEASEALQSAEGYEDVQQVLSDAAEAIRALAQEKAESADNIEDGFGHETQASADLREIADGLESWADDLDGTDLPEYPEPEEADCEDCSGDGTVEVDGQDVDCETCSATGKVTPDEPTEEQVDDWRMEAVQAVEDALANRPV